MSLTPPSDNRLAHLIAQQLNVHLDWHLALLLAEEAVRSPTVQAEVQRIGQAHADAEPCGDRHCTTCWAAHFARSTIDLGDHPCTTTPLDAPSLPTPPTDSPSG